MFTTPIRKRKGYSALTSCRHFLDLCSSLLGSQNLSYDVGIIFSEGSLGFYGDIWGEIKLGKNKNGGEA